MRTVLLASVMFWMAGAAQAATWFLRQGESFSYRFDTLYLVTFFFGEEGGLDFRLRTNQISSDAVVRWEMFEAGPTGTPIASNTISGPLGSNHTVSVRVPGAWQDLDGSVRFTMVAGEGTIGSASFFAATPNGWFYADMERPAPVKIWQTGDQVHLRWSTNGPRYYVLQSRQNVIGENWTEVTDPRVEVDGDYILSIPITRATNRFFRVGQ